MIKKHISFATKTDTTTTVAITVIVMLLLSSTTIISTPFQNALSVNNNSNNAGMDNNNNNSKVVMLVFSDNPKNQFINAKPILDKYGFKATFFVVCNWLGQPDRMTWQDIQTLQNDGQDIESHSMNHKNIVHLSAADLDFEIGQSKQCLADHNISSTIFEGPHGEGWDNSTVINTIAKYYELGRLGYAPLMFLHCDGYTKESSQKDCRTYFDNGTLTFANRYSIRHLSHNDIDQNFSFHKNKIFNAFVNEVNEQPSKYNNNTDGSLTAIPIIGYHDIDNNRTATSTDIDEFANEMKYLHDNGFTVLPLTSLKYNQTTNYFYLNHTRYNKGSDNGNESKNNNTAGSSDLLSNADNGTTTVDTKS